MAVSSGTTVLIEAANLQIVEQLIAHGANVAARDRVRDTFLSCIVEYTKAF